MGLNTNYYWNSITTGYKNYPSLLSKESCDVVVIGGGISGCLTTYYLSQYNINTILLEKNFIAQGNASSSHGVLEKKADIDLEELSRLLGKKNAFYAHKLCEKAVDDIEFILYNINLMNIFQKKEILYSDNYGYNKNSLIKDTHTHIYSNECAMVNPFKLCHGLLKSAQKKYAKIYEDTAAISYDSYSNYIKVNTNKSYSIECKYIVFTNGLSIENILPLKNLMEIKKMDTVVTNPIENISLDIFNKNFVIAYNNDHTYINSTPDRRIMITSFNSQSNLYTRNGLLDLFRKHFEYSKDLSAEYSYTTIYGESKDGIPYIGAHPKFQNCFVNLSLGRNNICYSLIGAQIIKDLILYDYNPYSKLFSFQRG